MNRFEIIKDFPKYFYIYFKLSKLIIKILNNSKSSKYKHLVYLLRAASPDE